MSLEVELERARDAAARLGPPERRPDAVLPAEPHAGERVYLVAFAGDEEIRYLAVDGEGNAVTDRSLVRDAVAMLALAERADEVSGAVAADQLEEAFATAATELGSAGLAAERDAADAVRRSLAALSAVAAGPRVATPAYLDRIAACAAELSGALDVFAAHAERLPPDQAEPAAAAWRAMAAVARTGDPANLATSLTAAGGAVDALVGDVLAGYAAELEVMHTFDRAVAASLPLVPRTLVRRFADRYMAGETLEDAVATVRRLNSQDTMATVDVLGEFIRVPEEAEATTTAYERVLDAIAAESLDANISVKLSAWGWSSTTLSPIACSRGCWQPPSATTSSSASTWSTPASPTARCASIAACGRPATRRSESSSRRTCGGRWTMCGRSPTWRRAYAW